jgi:hypothetical protein
MNNTWQDIGRKGQQFELPLQLEITEVKAIDEKVRERFSLTQATDRGVDQFTHKAKKREFAVIRTVA